MIDIRGILKTVNSIIGKNSETHFSSIVLNARTKPQYNNGLNVPRVCRFNLQYCSDFYKSIENEKLVEKTCPFGFLVSKKVFDTSTKGYSIALFSILYHLYSTTSISFLNNLPRELKKNREVAIEELKDFKIDQKLQRENKEYLEQLIETLLIGRIGLAIQSISHQFFTPLQGAMSDVKNIELKNDVENSVRRLVKNFEALSKLATEVQLLLSTSDEFNKNMLRRVLVHTMVTEIFESLKATAKEKHLVLRQGFNSYSKAVDAIPGQLSIVLTNVIHNAVKYSFNGFPEEPLEVSVEYGFDPGYLIIVVKNEGCQITAEEIKDRLIFNLGYRGKYSQDRQRKGTGTGLYISNEIVRSHGGRIDVSSKYNGGSPQTGTDRYLNEFRISWPEIID